LTDIEEDILLKLINDKDTNTNLGYDWKLIYRATRDGWEDKDFHRKCDNFGSTVTIISTNSNNVFGGYTSIPWKSAPAWGTDSKAFLLLIRSSKQYQPQIFPIKTNKIEYAVCHISGYLCIFGGGHDIHIASNCNSSNYSYTDAASYRSYDIPTKHYLNGDQRKFKVREIEVYTST